MGNVESFSNPLSLIFLLLLALLPDDKDLILLLPLQSIWFWTQKQAELSEQLLFLRENQVLSPILVCFSLGHKTHLIVRVVLALPMPHTSPMELKIEKDGSCSLHSSAQGTLTWKVSILSSVWVYAWFGLEWYGHKEQSQVPVYSCYKENCATIPSGSLGFLLTSSTIYWLGDKTCACYRCDGLFFMETRALAALMHIAPVKMSSVVQEKNRLLFTPLVHC